jgi:signal transduction histidine kinase
MWLPDREAISCSGGERQLSQGHEAVYTPEETALRSRLRIYVNLRWLAIVAIALVALVASRVPGISFSALPIFIICIFMLAYNAVLFYLTRRLKSEKPGLIIPRVRALSNINIVLDIVALTLLLHFSGGVDNPFIFMYPIHSIAAGIVMPRRITYGLATFALFMAALLVTLEYFQVVPHIALFEQGQQGMYRQAGYVAGTMSALAALIYSCTYLTTTISGELKKRQREIVKLQGQLLETKEVELSQVSRDVAKLETEKRSFVRFLGVAAHDLQAPLVATRNALWVVLNDTSLALAAEQRTMLEKSNRRIAGLLALITDLLDVPQIESGHMVHEMTPVSLAEVIDQSVDNMRSVATEKGIGIEIDLLPEMPLVRGSAARLQQVLTNLISNAVKYSQEGRVLVRVREDYSNLQTDVIDSGVGISKDDLPRVFDDFFRAHNAEARGTGLGLSICRRIIEAHGGRIWVESPCQETGSGSRFSFTLPKEAELDETKSDKSRLNAKPIKIRGNVSYG